MGCKVAVGGGRDLGWEGISTAQGNTDSVVWEVKRLEMFGHLIKDLFIKVVDCYATQSVTQSVNTMCARIHCKCLLNNHEDKTLQLCTYQLWKDQGI